RTFSDLVRPYHSVALWIHPGGLISMQQVYATILQKLRDPDPRIRFANLRLLRESEPLTSDLLPAVRTALHDSDSSVRAEAVILIGLIGPPAAEAVDDLASVLFNQLESEHVRHFAAATLSLLGERALPTLILALQSSESLVN